MKTKQNITTKQLVLAALFCALTAIGAFIQIPVPFMDYFTLQFLFVLLAGMLLGGKLGGISVALYVFIGLIGFPIFAAGGGIQYVLRPSFGYLIGFIVTAFVVGILCDKKENPTFKNYLAFAFIGMLITYGIGFGYKYLMLNFYVKEATGLWAIVAASLPLDIPGDAVLCLLASATANRLRGVLKLER